LANARSIVKVCGAPATARVALDRGPVAGRLLARIEDRVLADGTRRKLQVDMSAGLRGRQPAPIQGAELEDKNVARRGANTQQGYVEQAIGSGIG
jgi:hypothetical protein